MVIIEIIILILVGLMPYKYLGFNLGNLLICLIGGCYIIFKKDVKIPKNKLTLIIFLYCLYAIFQTVFIRNVDSYVGIGGYFGIFIVYILIYNMINENRSLFINRYIYIIAILNMIFVISQGAIFDTRIDGLLGYANTYAIILLICMGICESKKIKYKNEILITLILGILYTGSRTTIILTVIYEIFIFFERGRDYKIILNIIFGCIFYILLENAFVLIILLLPFIIFFVRKVYQYKLKKKSLIFLSLVFIISISFSESNTIKRIMNISLNNLSFQERLITFKDSLSAIAKNPLGYGINSFYYNITEFKSSEYEVKYIHNSILNSGFEIGVIGSIILFIIFIFILCKIFKSKATLSSKILMCGIILHTLLDFDTVYLTFYITLFIYYFYNTSEENEKISLILSRILVIIVVFITLILGYVESIYELSSHLAYSKQIKEAETVSEYRLIDDLRLLNIRGNIEFYRYKNTKDKIHLEKSKLYLEEYLNNRKDPIAKENLKILLNEDEKN